MEAIATRSTRLEAIAIRLEAIAIRLEAIAAIATRVDVSFTFFLSRSLMESWTVSRSP